MLDVIVVGAGPSGSSAAYELAKTGLSVTLIDKEDFPRDKPCGGGLTNKTLNRLNVDVSGIVERHSNSMELTYCMKKAVTAPDLGVFCNMVQRPMFDTFLRDTAVNAGAVFKKVGRIEAVSHYRNHIDITLENGEAISARWLIAADGAKSRIRRLVHNKKVVSQAFALEGKAPLDKNQKVSFDFFVVPWGYGWVFPKGDHHNVGIITFNRKIKISHKELQEYCQAKLGHTNLSEVVGHPLGIGPHNGALGIRRILFVGDAAGNVEPLLGEGIHNAIYSGQKAAKAISKGGTTWLVHFRYWFTMQRQRLDIATSHNLALAFYRFPRLGWFFLSQKWFLRKLMAGFVNGERLDTSIRGF